MHSRITTINVLCKMQNTLNAKCLQVLLLPTIQTGVETVEKNPAREAIEKYAFSLSPTLVRSFFEANTALHVAIPVGRTFGTLELKLNNPLPSKTVLEDENGEISDVNMIHNVQQPDRYTYHADCSLSLPHDAYDYRGQPARTVDTILHILDNLLTTTDMGI